MHLVMLSVGGDIDAYVGLSTYFYAIYLCLMAALPKIMNYNIFTFVFSETRKNRCGSGVH